MSGSQTGGPDRRSRKKQRTRRQIHQAALALFAERGFDAVTLDQICEAADVARGTFFLHFPSKAALLHELEAQLADELADRLAQPRGSALAEYRTLVECFCEDWPRRAELRPDLLAALLREILSAPRAAQAAPAGLRGCIEDVVRRAQQRGELRRNVSPRLAATLFLAGAAALLSGNVSGEGEATPEQRRNELLHALLHGLVEPKPRLKWSAAPGNVA